MEKLKISNDIITEAKKVAFPYQNAAFNAIKDLEYSAIFHEQGLGKTKIAIDLILYWLKERIVDVVFIVTKKQLVYNWKTEFDIHTYIKPAILTNNKRDNYFVFNSISSIILTNFEVINIEFERIKLYLKTRNVGIIIDESAKIKNPESTISRSLFQLSSMFTKRVIMSGTPVSNRPYDIWSQIFFLDHGKSLGYDFTNFKLKTNLSNDLYDDEYHRNEFEHEINSIYAKIKDFTVRETKNNNVVTLPNKEYITVETSFEDYQMDLYKRVKNEAQAFVIKNDIAFLDSSEDILKRLLRLIQITSNPRLIDESYIQQSGKITPLQNLVETILGKNEKCIIWSSFIENIDYLHKLFVQYGAVEVHGKMSIEDRNKSINRFIANPAVRILFATPASAKEGLTLTVANHVIFYDRSLSLDDYLQAQDRIHRISQNKTCYIYNLIMKDSIDEWIDLLLNSKHLAAQLAQGDISIDSYREKIDYSFGEMVKLILSTNAEE